MEKYKYILYFYMYIYMCVKVLSFKIRADCVYNLPNESLCISPIVRNLKQKE